MNSISLCRKTSRLNYYAYSNSQWVFFFFFSCNLSNEMIDAVPLETIVDEDEEEGDSVLRSISVCFYYF